MNPRSVAGMVHPDCMCENLLACDNLAVNDLPFEVGHQENLRPIKAKGGT